MPHCIIDYTAPLAEQLDIQALVDAVYDATKTSGLFAEKDIKCRAVAHTHFKIGEGQSAFVCTTIKLISGRSFEQQEALAQAVLKAKRPLLGDLKAVTVEVIELSAVYLK